jgi:hypothetical protein
VREEGKSLGGIRSKLVTGLVMTLGALVPLQSCSGNTHDFTRRGNTAGTAGSEDNGGNANASGSNGKGGSGNTGGSGGSGGSVEAIAGMHSTAGGMDGGAGDGGGGGGSGPMGECEPGTIEACYESPDGTSYGAVPQVAVGSCTIGTRVCGTKATWGPCNGAVPAALTDTCVAGNDDNCNGKPNEGCPCTGTETRACGSDVGECAKGQQTCSNLQWGPCVGEVAPKATDTCDAGNDANCDGTPNAGCQCINGTTKECGSAVGNCKKGTQTCVNGVWAVECVGQVTARNQDSCGTAGDDANCNGVPNEGCACTSGQTQACGNCGTATCQSDGTWSAQCMNSGACKPGDIETDSVPCGNCGSQSRRRTCSNQCGWGAWENVNSCLGSGPCKVGDPDETRSIACGNCNSGQQQQKRSCTAQCNWPATWTNVGSCTGAGCTPNSKRAETSVSCGYCGGTQERESTCSAQCTWGNPTNKGACQQVSCSSYPNDERVGYVTCFNDWPDFQAAVCTNAQTCCMTNQGGYNCKATCDATEKAAVCDGPEDCGGSPCCLQFDFQAQTNYATCDPNCQNVRRCHTDADCNNGLVCKKDQSSASGGYNGRCL